MPATNTASATPIQISGARSSRMFTRGSAMPPSIPPLANAPCSRLTASSEALGSTGVFATLTRVPSCSASAASFEASSPKARICCTPSWRTASISAGGTELAVELERHAVMARAARHALSLRDAHAQRAGRRRRQRVDLAVRHARVEAAFVERVDGAREQAAVDDRDRQARRGRDRGGAAGARHRREGVVPVGRRGEQPFLEQVRQRLAQLGIGEARRRDRRREHVGRAEDELDLRRLGQQGDRRVAALHRGAEAHVVDDARGAELAALGERVLRRHEYQQSLRAALLQSSRCHSTITAWVDWVLRFTSDSMRVCARSRRTCPRTRKYREETLNSSSPPG